MLEAQGLLCREGKTVDAMILEVPRQRNSRKENGLVKNGEVPEGWKKQPRKLSQKVLNARWTRKRGINFYGYKNSITGGNTDHFVHDYVVSAANEHDSQIIPQSYFTAPSENSSVYGDSAYSAAICDLLTHE
ncbi:MAG: transposase [Luteolibacter sp.]